MINRRQLVIDLKKEYALINRYEIYLRSILLRTVDGGLDLINCIGPIHAELVDWICDHIDDLSEEVLVGIERVLLHGDKRGIDEHILCAAHNTAIRLYKDYLEYVLGVVSI